MSRVLRTIVEYIAFFHRYIASFLTDHFGITDDKLMHFIVIGVLSFALLLVLRPLITWLMRNHKEMTLTFFYSLTLILVLTFSIEIGQKITGTGGMEFADIVYGINGFLIAFAVYLILYKVISLLMKKGE